MTTPIPLPTHITRAQLLAACEALGFDPMVTTGFLINASTSRVYVTGNQEFDGRLLVVGDDVAKTTAEIPIQEHAPLTKRQRFAEEIIERIQAYCDHGDADCVHKGQIALAQMIADGELDGPPPSDSGAMREAASRLLTAANEAEAGR